MKILLRQTALLLILLIAGVAIATAQTGTLRIILEGIRPAAGGTLRVALFRGEAGWPKLTNAYALKQVSADQAELQVAFEKLPFAEAYAIEVHHDENNNGEFDMRWLPYPRPREGVGVSNNRFGFGHPDFQEARFVLDSAEKTLRIQMRY